MGGFSKAALVGAALLSACTVADTDGLRSQPVDASGLPAAPAVAAAPAPAVAAVPAPAAPELELERGPMPAAPAPAEPARPPLLAPGMHERTVDVDGHPRSWAIVVPAGRPTGLVVALHGVGARGLDMRSFEFEPLAGAGGVVVAYPDALGGAWNDGRPGADPVVPGVTVDDVRFLRLLIHETTRQTGVDGRRVAVVGYSAGAVMAGRVGCDLSDQVGAVALVAGSAGQGFEQSCRPAQPVAVLVVAGSDDRVVPYAGGRVANWGVKKRGFVAPVDDLFSFWATQDGCASTVAAAAGKVNEARGADCRLGTAVVRYRVNGGGHEWFRTPGFDTTATVWDFVVRRFSAVP